MLKMSGGNRFLDRIVFLPTEPVFGVWNLIIETLSIGNFIVYPFYTTFGFPQNIT